MTTELEIINPLKFNRWDQLVLSHKDYSFFHTSAWAKVLHNSYGYQPLYVTLKSANEIKLLIPLMNVRSFLTGRRGVSLPFTDVCPVIFSDGIKLVNVLDFLISYGKKLNWKYIELRSDKYIGHNIWVSAEYLSHILPLHENEEAILSSFRDSTKRNIKKATREGVKVHISDSLDAVREFYRLHCLTRKRHGLPPQPFRFFKELYGNVIAQDHGTLILASQRGQAIAGAIFFHFGKKALYKYGASDLTFQNLRANNLVMWTAIQHYMRKKFESLDMGRTGIQNYGLMQFKNGWGVQQNRFYYYKIVLSKQTAVKISPWIIGAAQKLASNLPIPFLQLIGKFTYRHIG